MGAGENKEWKEHGICLQMENIVVESVLFPL